MKSKILLYLGAALFIWPFVFGNYIPSSFSYGESLIKWSIFAGIGAMLIYLVLRAYGPKFESTVNQSPEQSKRYKRGVMLIILSVVLVFPGLLMIAISADSNNGSTITHMTIGVCVVIGLVLLSGLSMLVSKKR
jgi:hypothetical protein